VTIGKMPMPLYTTPMLWDGDIIRRRGRKIQALRGRCGFIRQFRPIHLPGQRPGHRASLERHLPAGWQVGANLKLTKDISFKVAPVLYSYTGVGRLNGNNSAQGENQVFTGEGFAGVKRRQGR